MQSDSKTSSSQKCFAVVSFWIGRSEMKNLNLSSSNMRFLANASEWQKATALENACHSEHNIAEWRISYQNMSFWIEQSEMKNLNLSSSNMRFLAFARNDITVILKGNTLKNLSPSEPIVRTLTYVRDDKRCHSDDRKRGRISFQRTSASGFLIPEQKWQTSSCQIPCHSERNSVK